MNDAVNDTPPPDYRRILRIVSGAMFAGAGIFLVLAWFLRHSVRRPYGIPLLAYIATAFAVVASVVAWQLRSGAPAPGESTSPGIAQADYARQIVALGVMEGAVLFCAIAVMLGPYDWPAIPAAILLALILSRAVGTGN